MSDNKLLLVDDEPVNLQLLRQILRNRYELSFAKSGEAALASVQREHPDLILLDVMMPGMDGYAVCRQLQAAEATREIPIIFITALNSDESEATALNLGAVDYITKPVIPAIVRARVAIQLQLQQQRRLLAEQNLQLQRERAMVEAIVERMQQDRQFDHRFLRFITLPLERTNGDILLSGFSPQGRQMVLLGDFTGHGISAAIGGPLVAYIFYTMVKQGAEPVALLEELNRVLQQQLPANLYLAATLIAINPDRTALRLWSAALPPAYLMEEGQITPLHSTFPPLGITPLRFGDGIGLPLTPKSRLYLYTDGLVEVENSAAELYGEERLLPLLQQLYNDQISSETLLAQIRHYAGDQPLRDDITLLEIGSRDNRPPQPHSP